VAWAVLEACFLRLRLYKRKATRQMMATTAAEPTAMPAMAPVPSEEPLAEVEEALEFEPLPVLPFESLPLLEPSVGLET